VLVAEAAGICEAAGGCSGACGRVRWCSTEGATAQAVEDIARGENGEDGQRRSGLLVWSEKVEGCFCKIVRPTSNHGQRE
jgi:hypothetical protein